MIGIVSLLDSQLILFDSFNEKSSLVIEDLIINNTPYFYDDSIFNITEWDAAKLLDLPSMNLWYKKPTEIMKMIESLCNSFFGTFLVQADGKFTIKIRDLEKERENK